MVEREEIEAMWNRIKSLEENGLKIACNTAAFEIQFMHNWALTSLGIFKPSEIESFVKYMKPKSEVAQKAVMETDDVEVAFKTAFDFQNDCLSYLKSQLEK